MGPVVHRVAEGVGGLDQLREGSVLVAQVGRGRHQVALGDLHRRLHPLLDSGSYGSQDSTLQPWWAPTATIVGCRTGMPATCSIITVFSSSESR